MTGNESVKGTNDDDDNNNNTTTRHTHAHLLPDCSVGTYIVIPRRPAGVELHVELPFLAG